MDDLFLGGCGIQADEPLWSPDRAYGALGFVMDCGATTAPTGYVSVLAAGDEPGEGIPVYRNRERIPGDVPAFSWEDIRRLRIHAPAAGLLRERVGEVAITAH